MKKKESGGMKRKYKRWKFKHINKHNFEWIKQNQKTYESYKKLNIIESLKIKNTKHILKRADMATMLANKIDLKIKTLNKTAIVILNKCMTYQGNIIVMNLQVLHYQLKKTKALK